MVLAPWPPMGVLSMGLEHCHRGNTLKRRAKLTEQIWLAGTSNGISPWPVHNCPLPIKLHFRVPHPISKEETSEMVKLAPAHKMTDKKWTLKVKIAEYKKRISCTFLIQIAPLYGLTKLSCYASYWKQILLKIILIFFHLSLPFLIQISPTKNSKKWVICMDKGGSGGKCSGPALIFPLQWQAICVKLQLTWVGICAMSC